VKYLMFYEVSAEGMAKVQAHLPSHQARLEQFHDAGTLLMAGPYGSPPKGALGIFTTRAAAEEFVAGDSFIVHGVVSKYRIEEWLEALVP
jgi:uncharacterized protein YciI